jgi:hypothetical protein
MAKTNKNAASEDEVGSLHKGITRAFTKGVDVMLREVEEAEEADDITGIKLALGNFQFLSAAAKWVQMNEVVCTDAAEEKDNALKDKLAAIKAKQGAKVFTMVDRAKEA